jgi:hypothetical protein
MVCRWILYAWNPEIQLITELPGGFSVPNAGVLVPKWGFLNRYP